MYINNVSVLGNSFIGSTILQVMKYIYLYFCSQGWIIKMKVDNPEELDTLMNEEDYDKFVREQDSE